MTGITPFNAPPLACSCLLQRRKEQEAQMLVERVKEAEEQAQRLARKARRAEEAVHKAQQAAHKVHLQQWGAGWGSGV